jgi:hypothetical protein
VGRLLYLSLLLAVAVALAQHQVAVIKAAQVVAAVWRIKTIFLFLSGKHIMLLLAVEEMSPLVVRVKAILNYPQTAQS